MSDRRSEAHHSCCCTWSDGRNTGFFFHPNLDLGSQSRPRPPSILPAPSLSPHPPPLSPPPSPPPAPPLFLPPPDPLPSPHLTPRPATQAIHALIFITRFSQSISFVVQLSRRLFSTHSTWMSHLLIINPLLWPRHNDMYTRSVRCSIGDDSVKPVYEL